MSRSLLAVSLIIAFLLGAATALMTLAAMQWVRRIPSTAIVKTIGVDVYLDSELTTPVVNIDWGILEPGENKNFNVYVVNHGNVPIVLSLTTENWQPANASNFITVTWNYDRYPIAVSGYTYVTFTLHVDPATTGIDSFSFTIMIVGSG